MNNDIKINATYNYGVVDGSAKLSYLYGDLDKNTGLGLSNSPWSYPKDKTKEHAIDVFASVPFTFNNLEHEFLAINVIPMKTILVFTLFFFDFYLEKRFFFYKVSGLNDSPPLVFS